VKKKILFIAILIASFLLSGCWDYMEYEQMAMVSALGIDFNKDTGKITVTVQVIEASSSGAQGQSGDSGQKGGKSKPSVEVMVLSATDVTLTRALTEIQQGTGRRLFYGYQQLLVISEDAAKNIMDEIEGYFDRTPQVRSTAYLIVTSQSCEDVLSTIDPGIKGIPSENIYRLVKISGDTGKSSAVSIKDFSQAMAIGGLEAVAPRIITRSSQEKGMQQNENDNNIQHVKFIETKDGHHIVQGIAAFKGVKLAGWLDSKESLGWAWITDKSIKTYETTNRSEETYSKETIDFRITKSKSSIKPKFDGNKLVINVDVHVEATLVKSKKNSDLLTPDVLSSMEKELSDCVNGDIKASLEKVQKELKTDIFGFGFSFYRKYPKLWHSTYEQKWDELFPDIPVLVNVDAKLINTGTTIRRFIFK